MSSVPDREPIRSGWLPAGYRLGRYEVLAKLASGGMARVYVANAQGAAGFERLVAIKVLHANLAYEEEFIRMFLDEARLAARIRHPNVVATIDISDTADTGYFLVMEYVEGDHLGALLANAHKLGERIPMPVVLRIVIDALSGLGAAHDLRDDDGSLLNLVHRDVSPHNVLVGRDGVARLTDFGVAKAEDRLANTRDGQVKGKIAYMAPEQASVGRCDSRSDLFAMAIVLWECATGQRLFRAENSAATLHRLLNEEILPPSAIDPALAALDPVLNKALARAPEHRFQTAEEFVEALERVAPRLGGVAPRRTLARSVERYAREKLERDRKLVDVALVALRNGEPMRSEPAPAMAEASSPSRTQQRVREVTPAAGTVPRLFTSARVPRMDIEVVPELDAEDTSPHHQLPEPPPPLGGGFAPAPALRGGPFVPAPAPGLRGGPPFDELLIVQARRRTRITWVACALGLLAAAGTAGWFWYASARPTHAAPPPSAPLSSSPVPEPTALDSVVVPPQPALEQVVQPPVDRPQSSPTGAHTASPGGSRSRADRSTPRPTNSASSQAATPAAGTQGAPAAPTFQLTPAPAEADDGLLPNPYRRD